MSEWMIKGKVLENYLNACKTADLDNIEANPILMNMFNKKQQYQDVLTRVVDLFGSLTGMRICEIGGGYGGQAKAILDNYEPECYHMIDLPEVCELQRTYLKGTIAKCMPRVSFKSYDLIISNYALSEIPDNKYYIDEVLRRSKHGYITCNTDLVKLDFKHSRMPDIPGERETNYVLWW